MQTPIRLVLAALLAAASAATAAPPERILIEGFASWSKGRPEGVSVREPGRLVVGPDIATIHAWEDRVIWSVAPTANGKELILGTGPDGAVWRVTAEGKATELHSFDEPHVYAVAIGSKGRIYAAPSPGGTVYLRDEGGKFEPFYETGDEYVWALVLGPDGALYAATGPGGKVHRITGKENGVVWFASDEAHIRSLAFDAENQLLAGSSGNGLLYRITGKDQAVVLLTTGREEIPAIAVAANGDIHAAAVGPRATMPSSPPRGAARNAPQIASRGLVTVSTSDEPSPPSGENQEERRAPSRVTERGGSELFRISGGYHPRSIWQSEEVIYALAPDGDGVRIATGPNGNLYRIDAEGRTEHTARIASDVAAALAVTPERTWIAATDASTILAFPNGQARRGRYLSETIDSKLSADWGSLRVSGSGRWSVRTRSGNTPNPDVSWYPWVQLQASAVQSPPARYLQFEITLESGEVDRVELFYQPRNQPPVVDSLKVLDPGVGYEMLSQPAQPPQPQTPDQLVKSGGTSRQNPDRYQPVARPGMRTIAWQASDPNNDELLFSVEIREEKSKRWETLIGETRESVFSWDTSGWPDGTYYVRITASDELDNPDGNGLTAVRESESWQIDNTPPDIRLRQATRTHAEFVVEDSASILRAVSVSTDGRDFRLVQPEDGILDSMLERFRVPRDPAMSLYIRTEDLAGNVRGLRIPPMD